MKTQLVLVICIGLLMSACGKEESPAQNAVSPQATSASASASGQTHIIANNYSDSTWKNGVNVSASNAYSFYFLINAEDLNPLQVGGKLVFNKSGEATVMKMDVAKQGSVYAVFVTVDKPLDPVGDGFPHAIQLR